MSDETRTVTVESLAAVLRTNPGKIETLRETEYGWIPVPDDEAAAAIFAALPVATAGPDVDGEKAILDRVRRLAERADPDHVDAVVSFTRQNLAALRGAAAQADGGEAPERIFVSPERIEEAIEQLGPTGDLAEAYVKLAATAAVHVLRGGRIEYVPPAATPDPAP